MMMPKDFKGTIKLETACLGKHVVGGNITVPTSKEKRTHSFFFCGLEFSNTEGDISTYAMFLDSDGKYDYDQEHGFLSLRVINSC